MVERPILFSGPMVLAILAGKKTQTRRPVKKFTITGPNEYGIFDWHDDRRGGKWAGAHKGNGNHPGRRVGIVKEERDNALSLCPYGVAGDRLWVRETWGYRGSMWSGDKPGEITAYVDYQADGKKLAYQRPHVPGQVGVEGMPRQRCGKDCDGDPGGIHGDELTRYWRSWRPSIHMPRWASRILLEITNVRVQRLQAITETDARDEGVARDNEPCDHIRQSCADVGCLGPDYRAAFCELWEEINGKRYPWSTNPWVWVVGFKAVKP